MKSFREKVEATATYKSLTGVQRISTLSTTNLKHLEAGFTISKNIGFEKWKNQSGYLERNIAIISDLHNLENKPNEPELQPVRSPQVFAHVQATELAVLKNYSEWKEFISGRQTETLYLILNESGHHVKGLHLMNDDNYPVTVYETQAPAVRSVSYHSLTNN